MGVVFFYFISFINYIAIKTPIIVFDEGNHLCYLKLKTLY